MQLLVGRWCGCSPPVAYFLLLLAEAARLWTRCRHRRRRRRRRGRCRPRREAVDSTFHQEKSYPEKFSFSESLVQTLTRKNFL